MTKYIMSGNKSCLGLFSGYLTLIIIIKENKDSNISGPNPNILPSVSISIYSLSSPVFTCPPPSCPLSVNPVRNPISYTFATSLILFSKV